MSTLFFWPVLSGPNFHELSCWSICRIARTQIQYFSATNWQENDRRTLCLLVCNHNSEQYQFELVRRFPSQLGHIHRMLLSQCEKSVSLFNSIKIVQCNETKLNEMFSLLKIIGSKRLSKIRDGPARTDPNNPVWFQSNQVCQNSEERVANK